MVVYTLTVISGEDNSFTVDVYETEKQACEAAVKCILEDADALGFNDPNAYSKETFDAFRLATCCFLTGKPDDIHIGIRGWNELTDYDDVKYENHFFYAVEVRTVFTEKDKAACKHSNNNSTQVPVAVKQEEKPCQVCKANNYLDVTECWRCGNKPW
jgi:hypothetical protein